MFRYGFTAWLYECSFCEWWENFCECQSPTSVCWTHDACVSTIHTHNDETHQYPTILKCISARQEWLHYNWSVTENIARWTLNIMVWQVNNSSLRAEHQAYELSLRAGHQAYEVSLRAESHEWSYVQKPTNSNIRAEHQTCSSSTCPDWWSATYKCNVFVHNRWSDACEHYIHL